MSTESVIDLPSPDDTEALSAVIQQIESLEAEKAVTSGHIRDIYAHAKDVGFNLKAIRTVVKLRKKSKLEREQEDNIISAYLQVLGDE